MICFGLTIVFAGLESRNYRTQMNSLRGNLEIFASTQALALAAPVWHLDKKALDILVQVMAQHPDVLTILVTDPDGNTISEASPHTKSETHPDLRAERPIIYTNQ